MSSIARFFLVLVGTAGFAGAAQADYIATSWGRHVGDSRTIDPSQPYSYSHDIGEDGFVAGSDLVTSFLLSIDLYDQSGERWYDLEAAFVDIPGLLGDGLVFNFGSDAYQGWSVAGLFELNLLGRLSVTITSLYGNFVFGGSDLTANGYAWTTSTSVPGASVPEPATLGLLGLGLLGVGFSTRRRKAAAKP